MERLRLAAQPDDKTTLNEQHPKSLENPFFDMNSSRIKFTINLLMLIASTAVLSIYFTTTNHDKQEILDEAQKRSNIEIPVTPNLLSKKQEPGDQSLIANSTSTRSIDFYLEEIHEAERVGLSGVALRDAITGVLRKALANVPRDQFPLLLAEVRDPTSWMLISDEFVQMCISEGNLEVVTNWISTLEGSERQQIEGRAARFWAETDFPLALDFVGEIKDENSRRNATMQVFMGSGLRDYDALKEAGTNADLQFSWSSIEASVLSAVISNLTWTEGDFSSSIQIIDDARKNGVFVTEMVTSVAEAWSQQAPSECAKWVTTLPDGLSRPGVETLIQKWLRLDPFAASEWAATLSPGTNLDAAAISIASHTISDDPKAALSWSQRISDEAVREKWLRANATRLKSIFE